MPAAVYRKPIVSSKLVTIDETVQAFDQFKGQFVRVNPTSQASDERLAMVKRELKTAGAVAVRMMPKPPSDHVRLGGAAELVVSIMGAKDEIPPVRELIVAMVGRSTSANKPGLEALLLGLADEEGL